MYWYEPNNDGYFCFSFSVLSVFVSLCSSNPVFIQFIFASFNFRSTYGRILDRYDVATNESTCYMLFSGLPMPIAFMLHNGIWNICIKHMKQQNIIISMANTKYKLKINTIEPCLLFISVYRVTEYWNRFIGNDVMCNVKLIVLISKLRKQKFTKA